MARKLIQKVRLEGKENSHPGELSGGQQQRVAIAREVSDHIYFTDRGVIVEHGPPSTFFTEAKDPRTRQFLSQIL